MESIRIPRRFRCPDPAEKIGRVTNKQERSLRFQGLLGYLGLEIKDGKAVRERRIVRSFMQIFSVQFPDSNEEELGQICGEILVDTLRIFDRPMDKSSCHDINREGYARLNGPMFPINANCDLVILPRLYRKNQPGDFFHPERGITFDKWGTPEGGVIFFHTERGLIFDKGEGPEKGVVIPALDFPGLNGKYLFEQMSIMKKYNRLISRECMTTCGRLKVNYATFNDAAEAFMTVRLVEWRREGDGARVFGRIRTSSTLLRDDGAKSVVFDLKRDESQRVRRQEYIRLHRPMTAVPMGSKLKVEVEIELENMMSSRDNDRDVVTAKGVCLFESRSTKDDVYENKPANYEDESTDEVDESVDGEDEYAADEDESADGEDESADDEDESADGEDESADEEDPFTESSDEETSSSDDKDSDDFSVGGVGEEGEEDESKHEIAAIPQVISGEWGKIEVGVYWLPCWCRGFTQDEDPST